MAYEILVNFSDGDSFGNWDSSEYLNLNWKNKEVARKNLQYIKEHHEMYKETEDVYRKGILEEVREKYKNKPWYREKAGSDDTESGRLFLIQHSLFLEDDNGNKVTQSAFWHGYFERLQSCEIVEGKNEDRIEF